MSALNKLAQNNQTMKLIVIALAAIALSSCGGITGTVNIPLPDSLGGGTVPIVITPQK